MIATMVGTLVMAPKSVTFRRHDHLVSVLFGNLLSHSYNITFSMFLDLFIIFLTRFYTAVGYEVGMAESPCICQAGVCNALL